MKRTGLGKFMGEGQNFEQLYFRIADISNI